jgi:hypothetical protein
MQPELHTTEISLRIYNEDKHWRLRGYSNVTYFKFEAKNSDFDTTKSIQALKKYV